MGKNKLLVNNCVCIYGSPPHPGNISVTLVTNLITSGLNPLFIVSVFKMNRCYRHVSGTELQT